MKKNRKARRAEQARAKAGSGVSEFRMQYEMILPNPGPLAGFAAAAARGPDQKVSVIAFEVVTSEDGETLTSRLENITRLFLGPAQAKNPWVIPFVASLIVIVSRDNRAKVYINGPEFITSVQAKRDVKAGDPVYADTIADVQQMMPRGLTIPEDAGYFILFSAGWRKALVYDLRPLHPTTYEKYDRPVLPKLLGGVYSYLMFQGRFTLTDAEWKALFDKAWFLFTALKPDTVEKLVQHVRAGWDPDELVADIAKDVETWLPDWAAKLGSSQLFGRHARVLQEAVDAYRQGKCGIAAITFFTQIEGVLREHHATVSASKPNQNSFTASAVADPLGVRQELSLLLPKRFEQYLLECMYGFEDFKDPTKVQRVTRHSIAHGVVPQDALDQKSALLGILTIAQLGYLLGPIVGAKKPDPGQTGGS